MRLRVRQEKDPERGLPLKAACKRNRKKQKPNEITCFPPLSTPQTCQPTGGFPASLCQGDANACSLTVIAYGTLIPSFYSRGLTLSSILFENLMIPILFLQAGRLGTKKRRFIFPQGRTTAEMQAGCKCRPVTSFGLSRPGHGSIARPCPRVGTKGILLEFSVSHAKLRKAGCRSFVEFHDSRLDGTRVVSRAKPVASTELVC